MISSINMCSTEPYALATWCQTTGISLFPSFASLMSWLEMLVCSTHPEKPWVFYVDTLWCKTRVFSIILSSFPENVFERLFMYQIPLMLKIIFIPEHLGTKCIIILSMETSIKIWNLWPLNQGRPYCEIVRNLWISFLTLNISSQTGCLVLMNVRPVPNLSNS